MLSDEWLQRYRLLENFTAKWNGNGNGNAYDWGDYNSSFALRAVELKMIKKSEDKYTFYCISTYCQSGPSDDAFDFIYHSPVNLLISCEKYW